MLNRCEFIGNLGRDPDARVLQNGTRVVNLSMAVTEKYKDANGERKERTTWVPFVIWNDHIGEIAEKYLKKGSRCRLVGEFQTRKYTDKDGADKYTTEIVLQKFRGELTLLDARGDREDAEPAVRAATATKPAPALDLDEAPF
jgi:single-strand DNA-binding protein